MVAVFTQHHLAQQLRASNHQAFTAFVEQHYERALRVAYAVLQSDDTAQDVAQDVFIRLWNRRATIEPEQLTLAYLLSAVHRRALDIRKHDQVRERYRERHATLAPVIDDPADPILTSAAFDEAMQHLPERWQVALRLRFQEGLTVPELATIMGISTNATHQLLHRAIVHLRQLIRI